jgi:hypothetical protein
MRTSIGLVLPRVLAGFTIGARAAWGSLTSINLAFNPCPVFHPATAPGAGRMTDYGFGSVCSNPGGYDALWHSELLAISELCGVVIIGVLLE